ncbi:MAG: acyl-CoA thioesterase [Verrucomicrobiaceae bacterium]
MMEGRIHELAIRVDSSVIDGNGHVNNVAYVEWMQRVAVSHASTWQIDALMEENGTTWFARRHGIEYLRPVFEGDEVVARTWIAGAERVKSLRRYEFYRNEELVARGETEWVYVDVSSGRPRRIPEVMRDFVLGE